MVSKVFRFVCYDSKVPVSMVWFTGDKIRYGKKQRTGEILISPRTVGASGEI